MEIRKIWLKPFISYFELCNFFIFSFKTHNYFLTGERLVEANQEQQFNRSVDDVELWLAETESHLESTDLGKVSYTKSP